MSEWYRNSDGWEDGFEYIDLGYDGSFNAFRRKIMNGRVIYEGEFWNAGTDERVPAYLDVIVEGENINHWIHAEIIPHNQ